MKRPPRRKVVEFLLGPWMLFPQALLVAWLVGGVLYEPPEIHRHLERHLFLQGSTDWGGGCLFAGTIALYVAFGFTSAWFLVLKLEESPGDIGFLRLLGRACWVLKFHILGFMVGGMANWGYDASVMENDFRNMFLLSGLLYALTILLICVLHRSRMSTRWKLALAPFLTVLWLVIGSDGNTARAGQLVQSGQDPQPVTRGIRHSVMLSWHRACDSLLGDISETK